MSIKEREIIKDLLWLMLNQPEKVAVNMINAPQYKVASNYIHGEYGIKFAMREAIRAYRARRDIDNQIKIEAGKQYRNS